MNVKACENECKKQLRLYRDKSKFSSENFNEDLASQLEMHFENEPALDVNNFNTSYNKFIEIINKTVDQHVPVKKYSRKHQKLKNKPWITKGILVSIRNKNKMIKSHYLSHDKEKIKLYKTYSNKLTKLKTISKKKYYADEFPKCKNDARNAWKILRNLLPSEHNSESKLPNFITTTFNQPVSMSTQNVGFLNVGRVQSGLFQPPFSKIPCLLKPALYLRPRKPTIMLKLARIKLEST